MTTAYRSCNPAALYDAVGADRAGFAQLLGLFVSSAPSMLATVRQCRDAGGGSAQTHALHELRSSALLVGAVPLAALLAAAESGSRSSGAALDSAAFDAIAAALDGVLAELHLALACPDRP